VADYIRTDFTAGGRGALLFGKIDQHIKELEAA
jgi:hypothetical protein